MRKLVENNYLMLGLTLGALLLGLAFFQNAPLQKSFWAFGALVGLLLAIYLIVDAIKAKAFGSDILALISISATALTDEWLAAVVIAVMLATGRALENWAAGRARMQLQALLERAPRVGHLIDDKNRITDLPLGQISVGSKLLVRSGEVVPLDGTLLSAGTFDESALTGEPIPKSYEAGSVINSGIVNAGQTLEIETTQTEETSTYSALIELVKAAQADSAPGVRIANKWAIRFVPFALALAGGTWLVTGELDRAVAVIVAATPCPLILAIPVAIISGMSRAASHGAIIKGGAALEQLARVKTLLLDKTGTLTQGGPEVSEIVTADGISTDRVLAFAAALEQSSPHIVAKAIVAQARDRDLMLESANDVIEDHGHGLIGTVGGTRVRVGQLTEKPAWSNISHSLLVGVWLNDELAAVIGLDDPLREDAVQTVSEMREIGVDKVLMVTGDRSETANEVGEAIGADAVYAECRPEQKLAIVKEQMQLDQGTVVVVGDGINDAPALAAAHVGVAMGARGATAASEAADVVIVEDSIRQLAIAVDTAQGARNRALQAAGVGMGLSILAMVGASFGLINATGSAFLQEGIDAAAILWALVPSARRIR